MHISNRKQFAGRALKMIAFCAVDGFAVGGNVEDVGAKVEFRQRRHAQLQSQRVLWGRKGFSGCGGYRQQ